jgi:hypothetical protein
LRARIAAGRAASYVHVRSKHAGLRRIIPVRSEMEILPFRLIAALAALALLAGVPVTHAQQAVPVNEIAAASGPIALSDKTIRVPLESRPGVTLSGRLADLGGRRLFLVLGNLQAAAQPGIIYEVYLGLPSGAAPTPNDPHYVGTLNFFAVAPPNTKPLWRSYDVTALAGRLVSQGPAEDLAVTIVPMQHSAAAAAANAIIGQASLQIQ